MKRLRRVCPLVCAAACGASAAPTMRVSLVAERALTSAPAGQPLRIPAEVPAAGIDPKYDFMYLIEVMDNAGNGKIYPDLEVETPYVVVKLLR